MCCTRSGRAAVTQTQPVFLQDIPQIHSYAVQGAHTQRVHVEQIGDSTARFAQHKRNPPSRMKADSQHGQPFGTHFKMVDLGTVLDKADAC